MKNKFKAKFKTRVNDEGVHLVWSNHPSYSGTGEGSTREEALEDYRMSIEMEIRDLQEIHSQCLNPKIKFEFK